MSKLLPTLKLRQIIIEKITKLMFVEKSQIPKFQKNIKSGEDGVYVFSDEKGYHYVISERGEEIVHKLTDQVFEISFWTVYPFVINESFEYERMHRKGNVDSRKIAFERQFETLKILGDDYVKRGEIEINILL